jgi:predicted SAM-dependent methyltransferase
MKTFTHKYPTGIKLNLGCGFDRRPGYVNVDLHAKHDPDLVADVTQLDTIADQSCTEALAQDVLEHLPRAKAETAVQEWNRVLQPQGRLVIRVPSLVHLLQLLSDKKRQGLEEQQNLVQCLYGTQGYEGDFHLNGFTEVTLRHLLTQAGFDVLSVEIVDQWLFEVQASKMRHLQPDPLLRVATDQEFIEQVYLKLLRRPVDSGGLHYYLENLVNGISREAVIDTLKASEEYKALTQNQPQAPKTTGWFGL